MDCSENFPLFLFPKLREHCISIKRTSFENCCCILNFININRLMDKFSVYTFIPIFYSSFFYYKIPKKEIFIIYSIIEFIIEYLNIHTIIWKFRKSSRFRIHSFKNASIIQLFDCKYSTLIFLETIVHSHSKSKRFIPIKKNYIPLFFSLSRNLLFSCITRHFIYIVVINGTGSPRNDITIGEEKWQKCNYPIIPDYSFFTFVQVARKPIAGA